MKAIPFQEQNMIFTKPKGMGDEECGSLYTYRGYEANSRLLNEEPEVRCRDCGYLSNMDDDDGMVLQCELSSQTVFLDDLPFTCMSRCPLVLERG